MWQGVRERQKCRSAVVLHESGPLDGVLQLRRNTSVTLGSAQGNGPDLCKGCGTGPKTASRHPGFEVGAGQASMEAAVAVTR